MEILFQQIGYEFNLNLSTQIIFDFHIFFCILINNAMHILLDIQ